MDELKEDQMYTNTTQKGAEHLIFAIKNMERFENHIEQIKFGADATLKGLSGCGLTH